jgi:hypothetical protein
LHDGNILCNEHKEDKGQRGQIILQEDKESYKEDKESNLTDKDEERETTDLQTRSNELNIFEAS